MKRLGFLFILAFMASSCAPAAAVTPPPESPTGTMVPAPTGTPAPRPTLTPTLAPTLIPRTPVTASNAKDIRLLRQISGVTGADIEWSPDGKLLAVAGSRGIILFDSATLQEISVIPNEFSDLFSVSPHILFSFDGTRILIAGPSRDIKWGGQVFDVRSGQEILKFKEFDEVTGICAPGKALASGGGYTGNPVYCVSPERSGSVYAGTLALSKDEAHSAVAGNALDLLQLDDQGSWQRLWRSAYHYPWGYRGGFEPSSAAFSPSGLILAAGFSGGDIHLYDAESGQEEYSLVASAYITGLAFSPDGSRLAYASASGSGVIDLRSDYRVTELGGMSPGSISDLAFSPDGRWLATANQADHFMLWDRDSSRLVDAWTMKSDPTTQKVGWLTCFPWAGHFAFSPDGERVALTRNGVLLMIEVRSHEVLYERNIDEATSIAFSPDGEFLATGTGFSSSGRDTLPDMPAVRIYKAGDGSPVHTLRGVSRGTWQGFPSGWNFNCIVDMAFAPDGRTLAVADMSSIKFWDVQSGERAWPEFDAKMNIFMDIAFSPDGSMFAAVDYGGKAKLWPIQDGKISRYPSREWNGLRWGNLAFSPDGSLICFVYRGDASFTLDIWATAGSDRILSKPIASHISYYASVGNQVVFSGDGGLLAIAPRGGVPSVIWIYGLAP